MAMDSFLGAVGTLAGVLVAVIIFALAARLVAKARQGNRRVREARHDPHVASRADARDARRHRDISQ